MITNLCEDNRLNETILLHAKYYIYVCFIRKEMPNLIVYKSMMDDLEKTERHIAEERNLLPVHNRKWNVN